MKYTQLGRTGLKVSQLCLGTMNFGGVTDEETSFQIMDVAQENGINFFDSANIYNRWMEGHQGGESETTIGKWLKQQKRDDIVIATKVRGTMWEGPNGEGLSRHHIISAVEGSLQRLQTDYIDLYQTHWPDDDTPLEETLSAMDDLVTSGKVRYIGSSNYPAWLLMKTLWVSDINHLVRFESIQPHYSIFHRSEFEAELEAACLDQNIGVIPYSPLASGFATGKYTRENRSPEGSSSHRNMVQKLLNNEESFKVLDVMRDVAQNHGASVTHIALAWLLAKPVMTSPIFGARSQDQLLDAIPSVDITLTDEEIKRLDDVSANF